MAVVPNALAINSFSGFIISSNVFRWSIGSMICSKYSLAKTKSVLGNVLMSVLIVNPYRFAKSFAISVCLVPAILVPITLQCGNIFFNKTVVSPTPQPKSTIVFISLLLSLTFTYINL